MYELIHVVRAAHRWREIIVKQDYCSYDPSVIGPMKMDNLIGYTHTDLFAKLVTNILHIFTKEQVPLLYIYNNKLISSNVPSLMVT